MNDTAARRHRAWWPPVSVAGACALTVLWFLDGVRAGDDVAAFDAGVSAGFVAARTTTLSSVAGVATWLGDVRALVPLAVVAGLALGVRRRSGRPALALAVAMAGASALTNLLKVVVARPRPPAETVLGPANGGYAFPSGHTLNSAVFLGVLCWLLWPRASAGRRAALLVCCLVLAVAVGLSRLYLGHHWMTDVLAGWVIAAGWLCGLLGLRRAATARVRRWPGSRSGRPGAD
jgi:membrane-associated phospholipid phosphatase